MFFISSVLFISSYTYQHSVVGCGKGGAEQTRSPGAASSAFFSKQTVSVQHGHDGLGSRRPQRILLFENLIKHEEEAASKNLAV
jgi:hypothetical protein